MRKNNMIENESKHQSLNMTEHVFKQLDNTNMNK